jgi:guanylate kinase
MPRENEEEGIDYFFLTGVEFSESMENNKFVEYSFHYGNWYGVRLSDIENSLRESHTLITLNWRGASALERKIQNSHVIYIEPPSVEILEKRLQDRGCYDRINYACEDMAQAKLFSHRVINDDLDEAYSSLLAIAENIV